MPWCETCLLVQPDSGYGSDNSCILDAIAKGEGRFKGIAIIDLDADAAMLKRFQAQGIVGAATIRRSTATIFTSTPPA